MAENPAGEEFRTTIAGREMTFRASVLSSSARGHIRAVLKAASLVDHGHTLLGGVPYVLYAAPIPPPTLGQPLGPVVFNEIVHRLFGVCIPWPAVLAPEINEGA